MYGGGLHTSESTVFPLSYNNIVMIVIVAKMYTCSMTGAIQQCQCIYSYVHTYTSMFTTCATRNVIHANDTRRGPRG